MPFGKLPFHLKYIEHLSKPINTVLPFLNGYWSSTVMIGYDIQLLWLGSLGAFQFFSIIRCAPVSSNHFLGLCQTISLQRELLNNRLYTGRLTGIYCQVSQPKGISSLHSFQKWMGASVSPHPHLHKVSCGKNWLVLFKFVRLERAPWPNFALHPPIGCKA